MFTQEWMEELEAPFRQQMKRMGKRAKEVYAVLEGCGKRTGEALRCLYASMPLCDALDYPPALFLSFAAHGAFLWENGPFAGRIPEKVFAAYVLHHRVNNEDMTEHRAFFFEELKGVVAGGDMREAVLRVNDWCASQVTYRSTDERTASPLCVYRSAFGRCGEESTFAVSVLRSLGIPARQVYVPLWSHCDDNHAWVEAWCDGEWVFLGACEPEAAVNRGWFSAAASRAMLVRSRWMLPVEPEEEREKIVSLGWDLSCSLNHLSRYAAACGLQVTVHDPQGAPLKDVRVGFEVMNGAGFGEIAFLRTGWDGSCFFSTGRGSLHVTARRGSLYGECMADPGKSGQCVILLEDRQKDGFQKERMDVWEDLLILAPEDAAGYVAGRAEEETRRKTEKVERAAALRREKECGLFDPILAERVMAGLEGKERERCLEILEGSRQNQAEIAGFLLRPIEGRWPEEWKMALLASLREKDWRDVTADILEDVCVQAAPWADMWEKELLIPFVLCPRVYNEMLRPHRAFLLKWLGREEVRECVRRLRTEGADESGAANGLSGPETERALPWAGEEIRKNPVLAWRLVQEWVHSDPKTEYGELVTSARSALESGFGSELTQRIICVQILRTLGIPARLSAADGMPEAWAEEAPSGGFLPLGRENRTGEILVCQEDGIQWVYQGNWTLARMEEEGWKPLFAGGMPEEGCKFRSAERMLEEGCDLWSAGGMLQEGCNLLAVDGMSGEGWSPRYTDGMPKEGCNLRPTDGMPGKRAKRILSVFPGKYRILTANRLPSGNILAKQMVFSLKEGERKEICLKLEQASLSDMFTSHRLSDFALKGEDGTSYPISELVKDRDGLFLWLGEDEEPTEHILREIDQRREEYAKQKAGLYFVAASPRVRKNPILARILREVGRARFLLDDFGEETQALARRMYLEPGRLPLAVLMSSDMVGVYGVAGYNVGTGDMLLKLMRRREESVENAGT